MADDIERVARELLAAEWGDHPQWAKVRERILDGSCSIHSDPLSLSCSIATSALAKAISSLDEARWQPIETAPKDQHVLVYRPAAPPGHRRCSVDVRLQKYGYQWTHSRGTEPPTRWRPLPPPPTHSGDGE